MKLVIVESPAKSKTIAKYLGEDYLVEASKGHINDLATKGKGGLGIDIENNFKTTYTLDNSKKDILKKLKDLASQSEEVILATDPDREGEAIAWHLANFLNLDLSTTKRLEFHEITKDSIQNAILNPRKIDMNLVDSQESRRIIDRIIGFKVSNLLYSNIKSKSAGRVQSVTLKLIVEREKEISEFKVEEYWTISAVITKDKKDYTINLVKFNDKKVEIKNEAEALDIVSKLDKKFIVNKINKTTKKISSKEPLITSTMQQLAFSRYNFKTKDTSAIAQKLYEGVKTDEGLVGLITYIRTDSPRLSDLFINQAKKYIIDNFGEKYYKGLKLSKKNNLAQDAHEAIRPTSLERTPESVKPYLDDKEYKLYKLIYNHTLASLMIDKINEVTTITFDNNGYDFTLSGTVVKEKGYDILKIDEDKNDVLPEFKENEVYDSKELSKEQHFTKPPSRYNEGKLVKAMEDNGIGRPSTYASTIQTLIQRKYVTSTKEGLIPTEQGVKTVNVLNKYFVDLMDIKYTAQMETKLDKITNGDEKRNEFLSDFYNPFIETFNDVKAKMYKDPLEYTGEKCPECGSGLVIRHGKNGDFVACSNYPKCKYVKKEAKEAPKETGDLCPICGSPLVIRKSKKGVEFIGCSNYPKCHFVKNIDDKDEEKKYCPTCGSLLVKRRSKRGYFYGCSNYPKCKYIENINKDEK